MNGVVAFVVITYSQCAKVSFQILTRSTLESIEGSDVNVVLLAGSVEYFSRRHMWYVVPAFIMTLYLLFVPLALIAYPLYFSCKKILPFSEESYTRLESSKLNLYIMPIVDAFQSSLKDDARVFAGLLFLYRLFICAAFAFPPDGLSSYACCELVLILVLTVRTIFHPFRSRFNNIVESLMFANLAIINGITVYNLAFYSKHSIYFQILACVQLVLIVIPLMIAMFILSCKLLMKLKVVRGRFCQSKMFFNPTMETNQSVFGDSKTNLTDFDEDQLPARMIEEDTRNREGKWTVVDVDESADIFNWRKRSYGAHVQGESIIKTN